MKTRTRHWLLHFVLVIGLIGAPQSHAADALSRREWKVEGVVREALVYVPPKPSTAAMPVVFAFHGHGGTMGHAARTFDYHTLWPEALVVYPQGLNTPGALTDAAGKKSGWQSRRGDQNDRDLKFFDVMVQALQQEYHLDAKRLYATGHSNGGSFTYLLWAERGDQFAAMAPSAAPAGRNLAQLKPKPVLHVAGRNDPLVKFAWQQATLTAVRKLNQCGEGKAWAPDCTIYDSKVGSPVVTFIHPGTHTFPAAAPTLIIKFFREQARP